LSQSSVIITAPLTSLPHHIRTSSTHLRVGRPGYLSPSTISNISVFNILQCNSSRSSLSPYIDLKVISKCDRLFHRVYYPMQAVMMLRKS